MPEDRWDVVATWHEQDPVTIWERHRNATIFKRQGNRNPFIDHPEWLADMAASKRFYLDRGLAVAKSFGRKYVEFATPSSPVKLALYGHRALAKDAGVSPDGSGSHRIVIGSPVGPFTDPDAFAWEAA